VGAITYSDAAMMEISDRIEALDETLFEQILSQTGEWDRRALLALHSATAEELGSFNYLEIGSYLGGSLQAVMRDPRCAHVVSIDPRPTNPRDKRGGSWSYDDNSTEHMVSLLSKLPGVDLNKLTSLDVDASTLDPQALPATPDLCFVDGEHSDDAVLRDARFCAAAVRGGGIIAFHDYQMVKPGIRTFLHDAWGTISSVVIFSGNSAQDDGGGGVLAVEVGQRGILNRPIIERAVGSNWHSVVWRLSGRPRRTPRPFLAAWAVVPTIDRAISTVGARRTS
jgi:hypothetical protein